MKGQDHCIWEKVGDRLCDASLRHCGRANTKSNHDTEEQTTGTPPTGRRYGGGTLVVETVTSETFTSQLWKSLGKLALLEPVQEIDNHFVGRAITPHSERTLPHPDWQTMGEVPMADIDNICRQVLALGPDVMDMDPGGS